MKPIKRPQDAEGIVRLLAVNDHPVTGAPIFPTMRELLCFAAVLGFSEGKRTPLPSACNEIDGRIFENSQQAIDLMYLIALADARDAGILHQDREDEVVRVFEEYATTGLRTIESWIAERPDDMYGDQALFSAFRSHGYLDAEGMDHKIDKSKVTF